MFLLCFLDEKGAFDIFVHILENVLPEKFYQKNCRGNGLMGFFTEKYILEKLAEHYFNLWNIDISTK